MELLKVGDRVEVLKGGLTFLRGEKGSVVAVDEVGFGVRFDNYRYSRHNCGGLCDDGHGAWVGRLSMEIYFKTIPKKKNNLLVQEEEL